MIEEIKRDDSLDHLNVLKALNEIPFPVGKRLLVDFLKGDMKNKSIQKNDLYSLHNFGALKFKSQEEISRMLESLIVNGLVDLSNGFNKYSKVLGIAEKGREELRSPTFNKRKTKNKINIEYSEVTDDERVLFRELDSFLGKYNEGQKKAIISNRKKVLCIAGAGSGKTSVLVKRIEFLVKYRGVDPRKILAITFTRKAKQEMETRLVSLGVSARVETFNSFCEKILRRYGAMIYDSPTRVMTWTDKVVAINSALSEVGLSMEEAIETYFTKSQKKIKENFQLANIFVNDCFSILEYFKAKNQKLYDFSKEIGKNKENAKLIFKVCSSIQRHMELQGLRDFTDQMVDAIRLFKKEGGVIPRFEHVLVDEYQDVNDMQIEFLELLNPGNLFCVGDPRQSIFGWRGSNINYILDFQKKNPEAEVINLGKNYRSSKKIINFMNHSIKDLELEDLEPHLERDGEISLIDFSSEEEEHDYVLDRIREEDIPREEIFVLARTNRQLDELSKKMKAKNIPHVVKSDEIKRPVSARRGEVTLATVHAIKGLDARVVFVVGCNETNFPSKASDHPVLEFVKEEQADKEEEERRLFYVAISRAKDKLYLTYSGKRHTYFITEEMKKKII